jgi:hypothetical protein
VTLANEAPHWMQNPASFAFGEEQVGQRFNAYASAGAMDLAAR